MSKPVKRWNVAIMGSLLADLEAECEVEGPWCTKSDFLKDTLRKAIERRRLSRLAKRDAFTADNVVEVLGRAKSYEVNDTSTVSIEDERDDLGMPKVLTGIVASNPFPPERG